MGARGHDKREPNRSFLIELVDQDDDMTMPELADAISAY
jgi:hypothetical protein